VCAAGLFAMGATACVPNGPPTGDAGRETEKISKKKQTAAVAASADPGAATFAAFDPVLTEPFVDRFDRAELGVDYRPAGPAWKLQDGRLCAEHARNRGIWLKRRLPVNAQIAFDAQSASPDGDVKVEVWGDGASGATTVSYGNATSYLAILGGWKNSLHVLARLDEHGHDRREIRLDPESEDERERPLSPEQTYHVEIERRDGHTIRVSVNGVRLLQLDDAEPLVGKGHDHLGFNDWDVPVCFDNLVITPR
jgi:hypothetical protein